MKLTEMDRKILKSYDTILDGLAAYLGEGCEIVLHSLENFDNSVIKIVNGHHTGRKVGAPITNVALEMLDEMQKDPNRTSISYFARNKNGEPLKSATIAIKGEDERIIGLLCINFYLNMPLSQFLSIFEFKDGTGTNTQAEVFRDNSSELLDDSISHAVQAVSCDSTIIPSLKNRNIIRILYKQGIFNMKNAVDYVAEKLNISKNTVYLHLRFIKSENRQQ
ncbi:MAG: hypothetical protein HFH15_16375 [Ruminococcus sp.]|nr:hypothetical protein [Ruminococcus sp.]